MKKLLLMFVATASIALASFAHANQDGGNGSGSNDSPSSISFVSPDTNVTGVLGYNSQNSAVYLKLKDGRNYLLATKGSNCPPQQQLLLDDKKTHVCVLTTNGISVDGTGDTADQVMAKAGQTFSTCEIGPPGYINGWPVIVTTTAFCSCEDMLSHGNYDNTYFYDNLPGGGHEW